jgi:hypothetical protein
LLAPLREGARWRGASDAFGGGGCGLFDGSRKAFARLPESAEGSACQLEMAELAKQCDLEYLRIEVPKAFTRTFDGVERVTNIVKAMKEFAHPDANQQSPVDLRHGLESTLLVASNEYKYVAKVHCEFGELPEVICNAGELNQVFLNLIVNAAHAIKDAGKDVETGEIKIRLSAEGGEAVIRVSDNGCGVPAENLSKLYDLFFTTKEVGRGTDKALRSATPSWWTNTEVRSETSAPASCRKKCASWPPLNQAPDIAKVTMACASTSSESTKGTLMPAEITDNSLHAINSTSA